MINTIKIGRIKWLDVRNPDENELKFLQKKFKFHPLDIEDCHSSYQRPKVEIHEKYRFAILQVPVCSRTCFRVTMTEIDVFWSDKFIVTVHYGDVPSISDLTERLQDRKARAKLGTLTGKRLFFELSNELVTQVYPMLSHYRGVIDQIDQEMFQPNSRKIVENINAVRRDLILSQTNIRQLAPIFSQLEDINKKAGDPIASYWGEILDKLNNLRDEFEDFQEIVEGLNSSLESLLNHRTSDIMKTLTIFNVVMLPLNFITSFYGMNLDSLPFAKTHQALIILLALMLSTSTSMVAYFKFKKWF